MNRLIHRTSRPRRGFTRIDFLFLLLIVLVSGIVAFPLFVEQRANARRVQCLRNMYKMGETLLSVAEVQGGKLPPLSAVSSVGNSSGQHTVTGWPAALLLAMGADPQAASNRFLCPADFVAVATPGRISFVMNTGFISRELYNGDPERRHIPGSLSWGGVPGDKDAVTVHAATGVIWHQSDAFESSLDYVKEGDGTSITVLISENLQAGSWTDTDTVKIGFGFPVANNAGVVPIGSKEFFGSAKYPLDTWWSDAMPITALPQDWMINSRLNAGVGTLPRPSSNHRGGANFILCDGAGKFLNEDMDLYFYYKFLTSNGVELGERYQ